MLRPRYSRRVRQQPPAQISLPDGPDMPWPQLGMCVLRAADGSLMGGVPEVVFEMKLRVTSTQLCYTRRIGHIKVSPQRRWWR